MARIVVVMGPYRSGTSLVSQILSDLGVFFGKPGSFSPPADRYNPGGYFQLPQVVRANQVLLCSRGGSQLEPGSPAELAGSGAGAAFQNVDVSAITRADMGGLKDPRFCATLQAWIQAGIVHESDLLLVRVRRDLSRSARSMLAHRELGQLCDGEPRIALETLRRYDSCADWHCRHLKVPIHEVHYESLVKDSSTCIGQLAAFIGRDDPVRVHRALQRVGKQRALRAHYLRKFGRPRDVLDSVVKTVTGFRGA